jgi:putative exosortase-associated protein (TIGR04073 family)
MVFTPMKKLICFLLAVSFASLAYADIQDPPGADYGPTRKLGRAISNIFWFSTEIPNTMEDLNEKEGNSSMWGYGIAKGVWRATFRYWAGWGELVTWPWPTYKGSYRPFYKSDIPWINGGYSEYPPELGFETKYDYTRDTNQY